MADLFWPGADRADGVLDDAALLSAMMRVEQAWLDALVATGVAPAEGACHLQGFVGDEDLAALSEGAESGGNAVIGLVRLLRERSPRPAADWLHRGLTSQDVLDTALVLLLREAARRVLSDLERQLGALVDLAQEHRLTPMVGRTLTQHAVPITVGAKLATWIDGLVDAHDGLARTRSDLAAQLAGAAGTSAAVVELAGVPERARAVREEAARVLDLDLRPTSWHVARTPFTRIGDALVECTDAWGHVASDVATLSRPEIGELAESAGGGSSTMPHKHNPALSVLLRRAAIAAPGLASTLHLASGLAVDERPDGAWHAEWATLQLLGRRTVVAASQATDLLTGLRLDTGRMARTLSTAEGTDAEQRTMAELAGHPPSASYLGLAAEQIDAAVDRARAVVGDRTGEGSR